MILVCRCVRYVKESPGGKLIAYSPTKAKASASTVCLNTATAEEMRVRFKGSGFGINSCRAVVAHREKHGLFKSVPDLQDVRMLLSGRKLGKRWERVRELCTL